MGYLCVYHDGEAPGVVIHQSLDIPSLVSVCREHEPIYHVDALAAQMGMDPQQLYDQLYEMQQEANPDSQPAATEPASDNQPVPAHDHYAIKIVPDGVNSVMICYCAQITNHDDQGNDATGTVPDGIISTICPQCEAPVFGVGAEIAANLRLHIAHAHDMQPPDFAFGGMDGDTPILFIAGPQAEVAES